MLDFDGPLTPERQRQVDENLGLIHFAIRRLTPWAQRIGEYDDYVQVGWTGLARATATWDPDRGAFTTFAYTCIRTALFRYAYHSGIMHHRGAGLYEFNPAARSLDAETPGGDHGANQLLRDRVEDRHSLWADERDDPGSGLTDDEAARLALIYEHALDDDLPMLELLAEGLSNVKASDRLGRSKSYAQKRVERLRRRIEAAAS